MSENQLILNNHKLVYDCLKDLSSRDFIDTMNLKVEDIEDCYNKMLLDVMRKERNDYIEKKLKIEPSFVGFFYYYIKVYKKIPSQLQFIKFYYLTNLKWIKKNISSKNLDQAFFGRLSRFYPSMLRDVHFYHVLRETGDYEDVVYNLKSDLEAKIDIFVKKNGKWYGLQLRTLTRRSNEFYQKKKFRNPIESKAILIDLPIDLNTAHSISTRKDSVKLYNTYHSDMVLEKIYALENAVAI